MVTSKPMEPEWTTGDGIDWRSHVEGTRSKYISRYSALAQQNTRKYSSLEEELPNLMNAAEQALAQRQYAAVLELAESLWTGGGQFLDLQGHAREGIQLLTRAVDAARQLGNRRQEEHRLLGQLARAAIALRDWPTAVLYLEQALPIARDVGDRRGEASHLGILGQVRLEEKDKAKAVDNFKAAMSIAREIGDLQMEGRLWASLGLVNFLDYNREGLIDAIRNLKKAVELARETGDVRGEASHLGSLGRAYQLFAQGLALPPFQGGSPYPGGDDDSRARYAIELETANRESYYESYWHYERALSLASSIHDQQMQNRFRVERDRVGSQGNLPLLSGGGINMNAYMRRSKPVIPLP